MPANQGQAPEQIIDLMDRQIFNQNLSVQGTSAYIMVTATMGQGLSPTYSILKNRWTVTEEELKKALEELIERKILVVAPGGSEDDTFYSPQPSSLWR